MTALCAYTVRLRKFTRLQRLGFTGIRGNGFGNPNFRKKLPKSSEIGFARNLMFRIRVKLKISQAKLKISPGFFLFYLSRAVLAPPHYDRDRERDESSRSSTLARGHSGAQHRRAPRSACESRHSCRHPLSISGPGSFALCAQAPGPRPYDILVWKLQ